MPIGRYIAWVGTSLLALLFLANWLFPQPLAEAIAADTDRPVIRIASMQKPLERVVIDASVPTIVQPPMLAADAISEEPTPQAQASELITSHGTAAGAEKTKRQAKKNQGK